jgi:ABC-type nitrate/sulfonate/bicarbonate transport system substrate-binding protein
MTSTSIRKLAAALALSMIAVNAWAQKAIRIGWQPTTTVEAQIAHTLARTDILEKNGLKGEMSMFAFGPAVNEALLSGAIDVGFIGDMPSVSLIATGAPITIVARQSTFRGSILAASKSGIKSVADLKGRKLYGPLGSSIYRSALTMLRDAGLNPGKDVEVIHMGFADLADALRAGKIEAMFVWDPWVELFVKEGLARELKSDSSLTMVVAMRDEFIKTGGDALERFLKSHKEALMYAASNKAVSNEWFRQPEAARRLDVSVIEIASAYDASWKAPVFANLKLAFSAGEFDRYKDVARFAFENKVTPKLSPLEQKTDMSVARKLDAAPWAFDPKSVKLR